MTTGEVDSLVEKHLIQLIYVGDPMCSWCWGFAPEVEALSLEHPVEVVVGGLRPGPAAQPLEENLTSFLRTHWVEIGEKTGQPFDTSFLDENPGWLYDTEPAAIAVALMRAMNKPQTLDYFTTIQHGFYAEGRDVTRFDVLTELARGLEIDSDDFRKRLGTDESKQDAWGDFSRSRSWGIGGFPALIAELPDNQLALLARGWTSADTIRTRIENLP